MNDYDRWKKRRDAERARRDREAAEDAQRRAEAPPSYRPAEPSPAQQASRPREPWEPPRRAYQGAVPPLPAPNARRARQGTGTGRGCLGCLGLLLGLLVLLTVAGVIFGTLYWRQLEQRGQVNVLVLGIDERRTEPPPFRSDTMILVGFDPRQQEVALLSIPRDLWVTIPDQGSNRVNTAHFFGGPVLAKRAVAENFGVPLNYYVKLNFDGFVSVIDAMGGITVDVPEALHDENYPTADYGVMTIDIPAGRQTMSGETALIYARSRYSTSDFDRGRRQQEIIGAIRAQLAQPGTWLKAPAIARAVLSALETDMPTLEWPALAMILVRSKVERAAIAPEDTEDFVTDGGAQVLLPRWERINLTLARYFE